ncbi:hypothetical protein Hdeb2414_s0004g00122121 [Helianthus debilis subsp. tardiflorus]
MASQHNEALLDAQSTFQQGQLHRDAPSGQQEGVLNQAENSVKTMAQGAADMAGGAASGVKSLAQGAATGAANVAEGAAGAVKNTFGSNQGS